MKQIYFLLVLALAFSGCTKAENGQVARKHIVALSETIGPREATEASEEKAAQYIQETFQKLGYTVELQPFFTLRMADGTTNPDYKSANVIACKPGLSGQVLVAGAHYDSFQAVNGADDNASGVAVMLEAAEKIRDVQTPYSICFIAFGARYLGMRGSEYYLEQASDSQLRNIVGMINLDGLLAGDIAYVYGDPEIRDWILDRAQTDGFNLETEGGDGLMFNGHPCECADHYPFQAKGIPFAYFEATNWNLGEKEGETQFDVKYGEQGKIWRTEYDNFKYIDKTFPGRVDEHLKVYVTLLYEILTEYQK